MNGAEIQKKNLAQANAYLYLSPAMLVSKFCELVCFGVKILNLVFFGVKKSVVLGSAENGDGVNKKTNITYVEMLLMQDGQPTREDSATQLLICETLRANDSG